MCILPRLSRGERISSAVFGFLEEERKEANIKEMSKAREEEDEQKRSLPGALA